MKLFIKKIEKQLMYKYEALPRKLSELLLVNIQIQILF